jgi:hypothetical protein
MIRTQATIVALCKNHDPATRIIYHIHRFPLSIGAAGVGTSQDEF